MLIFPLFAVLIVIFFLLFAAKNVASDIAVKLCDSVATKLEGKVLSTFSGGC